MKKTTVRKLVIPVGVIVTLVFFKINLVAGFTFLIGLCVGSLLEKAGLNERLK